MAWKYEGRHAAFGWVTSDGPPGEPGAHSDEINRHYYGANLIAESIPHEHGPLIAAAPDMADVLRQWKYSEEIGDTQEVENARKSRDQVLASIEMKASQHENP